MKNRRTIIRGVLTSILATALVACTSTKVQEETEVQFVSRALRENLTMQAVLKGQLDGYEKALDFWLKDPFKSAVLQHAKNRIGDGHIVNPNYVCKDGHFTADGKARLPAALTTNDDYCQREYSGAPDFAGKHAWSDLVGQLGRVRGDICVHGDMLRDPKMLNQTKLPKGLDLDSCREGAENYAAVYADLKNLQNSEAALRSQLSKVKP